MNNTEAQRGLDACEADLNQVQILITGLGQASNVVPYLTQYAVVRSCGSIEQSFKTIIADYCSHRSKKQVKRFLDKRIRDGSANPSLQNINKFLNDFDEDWKKGFKNKLDASPDKNNLLTSLQSLVDARNDFAHGGNPSASITDVIRYFLHSKKIIEFMDEVVV